MKIAVIVAWYDKAGMGKFIRVWKLARFSDRKIKLYFIEDPKMEGVAQTKNRGLVKAYRDGCNYFIFLDSDCFPVGLNFREFVDAHIAELNKEVEIPLYEAVTIPQSRGTPYNNLCVKKQVAVSMGFWEGSGDYDAYHEFLKTAQAEFIEGYFYKKFVSLSGMNIAFTREFAPLLAMPPVFRYEDIWSGWLAQKYIYDMGYCVSTCGPKILHCRQSSTNGNLLAEARHLFANENIWRYIEDIKPIYTGYATEDAMYLQRELVAALEAHNEEPSIAAAIRAIPQLAPLRAGLGRKEQ